MGFGSHKTIIKEVDSVAIHDTIAHLIMDKRTGDIAEFKRAAGELLAGSSPRIWDEATLELDRIFRKNTNIDCLEILSMHEGLKSPDGSYALMPLKAADCLRDSTRTAKFAKGLFEAISAARKTFTERPIRILYAGCGPFATLAMIVAPFFKEGEVEFTAFDIYTASYACAQGVAKNLGQFGKFKEIKGGDGMKYKVDGRRPHIIITETMQAQLLNEPQPQITAELGDQLEDGGSFLPKLVEVKAFAGRTKDSGIPNYPSVSDLALIGELFRLTPELAARVKDCNGQIDPAMLERELTVNKTFQVPEGAEKLSKLILQTRVHIFGSGWLTGDTPTKITRRIISDLRPFGVMPAKMRFSYVVGKSQDIEVESTSRFGNRSVVSLNNKKKEENGSFLKR